MTPRGLMLAVLADLDALRQMYRSARLIRSDDAQTRAGLEAWLGEVER